MKIHLIILPSTPETFKWSLSSGFPTKTLYTSLLSYHTCYMPRPSYRDEVMLHIFLTWETAGGGTSALRSGRMTPNEITSRTLRTDGWVRPTAGHDVLGTEKSISTGGIQKPDSQARSLVPTTAIPHNSLPSGDYYRRTSEGRIHSNC